MNIRMRFVVLILMLVLSTIGINFYNQGIVIAQDVMGDGVCTSVNTVTTPYQLNDWEVSNNYNSTFNSEFIFTPTGLLIDNGTENLARTRAMKVVNKPLTEIDSLNMVRTGAASYQLEATGWADGQAFATLVWEEIYNPSTGVFGGYWWRSGSALGVPNGVNSATSYESRHQVDLEAILAANPNLVILRYGVSLGSFQQGTSLITSIEFDCETTTFVSEPLACESIAEPIIATFNNRQGWELDDPTIATRADGYYEFVSSPTGLLMHTTNDPGQTTDKVAGYRPVNFHLKDIGSPSDLELVYSAIDGYPSLPPAGLQIRIDLDNNGTIDGFMAYEPMYYGEDWWSNSINTTSFPGLPSGGYPVEATAYEILDVYPDAHVLAIGFSLGSGVFGGGILESLTIGCQEYQFAPDQVIPDAPVFNEPTCSNQTASVSFPNNDFVYQVTGDTAPGGTVSVDATLKPSVKNKVAAGTTHWEHTFVTVESLNCPIPVTPENPDVTTIPENTCGVEGSVTPAETEHLTYVVDPLNPVEGLVRVTAIADDGYVSTDPNWEFVVYLGDFVACVDPVELTASAPTFVEQTCSIDADVVTNETDFIRFVVEGTVAPGETITVKAQLRDSVDPNSYTLIGDTEWSHTFAAAPDCTVDPTEVTADEPTFIEQTCDINAEVVTNETDFVRFDVVGTVAAGETVTVTAELRETVDPNQYTLTGDTEWVYTFAAAPDCTVDPTEVTADEPTFVEQTCSISTEVVTNETDFVRFEVEGTVTAGGTVTVTAQLRESVDPNLYALGGDIEWVHTFAAAPDCTEEPTVLTTVAPTFVEQTCFVEANVVIDDSDYIRYPLQRTPGPGETITVTAELRESVDPTLFVLEGDTLWSHTYADAPDCSEAEPTVVTPTLASFVTIPVDACNVQGSVTAPADTDQIDYSLAPSNPVSGTAVLFAEAKPGFVLPADYSPQVINLGQYRVCDAPVPTPEEVTVVPPTFVEPTCQDANPRIEVVGTQGVNLQVVGEVEPGKTVLVVASEDDPSKIVIKGQRYWLHEFKSLQDLNCGSTTLDEFMYLPVAEKQ